MQRFPDNILTGKPYGFALGMPCGWCQGPPALLEDRAPSGGAKARAAPTYLTAQPQQPQQVASACLQPPPGTARIWRTRCASCVRPTPMARRRPRRCWSSRADPGSKLGHSIEAVLLTWAAGLALGGPADWPSLWPGARRPGAFSCGQLRRCLMNLAREEMGGGVDHTETTRLAARANRIDFEKL